MRRNAMRDGWSRRIRKKAQQGQALVYGLFVLTGGLAALFFMFNTGQLSREKTKLVNTADAVAYSAGVMHARGLNYSAYTNRAMIANTVAIAQLVSLSSWVKYTANLGNFGFVAQNPKFIAFYPSYYSAVYSGDLLQETLNDTGALEALAKTSDNAIKNVLTNAQRVANAGMLPARTSVMSDVAQANYANDGSIELDTVPLTLNEYTSFVSRYSGDQRTRFAEVAKVAADKDPFVPKRSWKLSGLWADCASAFPRVDWLERRGGTELIGFDEWKAMDTLSEKRWVPKNKRDVFCRGRKEIPAGWGSASAADNPSFDSDLSHYDYSVPVNPKSSGLAMASSSSWGYSGLPSFYDLSEDMLKQGDPRLQFAIRLKRSKSQTVTSEGRSDVKNSDRLNAYQASPAGGDQLVAVGASEVYFERTGDGNEVRENQYGKSIGKPGELGSLFNPYWQVRLIHSTDSIKKAQLLQGSSLP